MLPKETKVTLHWSEEEVCYNSTSAARQSASVTKVSGHTHSERLGSSFTVRKNSGLKPLYNSDTEILKYKATLHYVEYKVHMRCYVPLSN